MLVLRTVGDILLYTFGPSVYPSGGLEVAVVNASQRSMEIALLSSEGKVVGFRRGVLRPPGYKELLRLITTSVLDMTLSLKSAEGPSHLGLSLLEVEEPDKEKLAQELSSYMALEDVVVMDDLEASYFSAFRREKGLLVYSGLRAGVCTLEGNKLVSSGGLGYILDGEASAYWMGAEALRFAIRSSDGRSIPTVLSSTLVNWLSLPDVGSISKWVAGATPQDIASLALLVIEAYEAEDKVASLIVERSLRSIADMAWTVFRRSAFAGEVKVAFRGAIFERSKKARKDLISRTSELGINAVESTRVVTPMLGIAIATLEHAGVQVGPEVEKRLLSELMSEQAASSTNV